MSLQTLLIPLQTDIVDSVLLTVIQALTVAAFLLISLAAVHLLVRTLRADHGRLRDRDTRLILVAAGVLFVAGFARLVAGNDVPHGSLAGVVLGFTAVGYLLYLTRPELFELPAQSETTEEPDRGSAD